MLTGGPGGGGGVGHCGGLSRRPGWVRGRLDGGGGLDEAPDSGTFGGYYNGDSEGPNVYFDNLPSGWSGTIGL